MVFDLCCLGLVVGARWFCAVCVWFAGCNFQCLFVDCILLSALWLRCGSVVALCLLCLCLGLMWVCCPGLLPFGVVFVYFVACIVSLVLCWRMFMFRFALACGLFGC